MKGRCPFPTMRGTCRPVAFGHIWRTPIHPWETGEYCACCYRRKRRRKVLGY